MQMSEETLLLEFGKTGPTKYSNKLSVIFSIICIVDVFGVFPVIALPKAVISCWLYGIVIVGLVCCVQMYTAILLGRCWAIAEEIDATIQKKSRYPYSALAELTFGKTLSKLVSFLLDITVFGGGIPNLIVASQNLELLGLRLSDNNFNVSFCYWIIILGAILCPILWLGSPKDMKLLCSISVTLVVLVFLLVSGCLIFSPATQSINDDPQRPLWELILVSYGIISFQFDIHPSILTIQVDMKEKSKLNLAVLGGFITSLTMFAIVATIAAVKFGVSTKPSILGTLPTTIPLHFAAIFVAVQLCLSSAVSNSALYQHMEDCMQISRGFNHRRCVLRTTLTLLGVLIAEAVPRFDLVMSLIGGTLTAPLVFILPPLFYLKMLSLQRRHSQQLAMESFTNIMYEDEERSTTLAKYTETQFRKEFDSKIVPWKKIEVTCCILIVLASSCCTLATTFVNINGAIKYGTFSQPCIFNVSSALMAL